MKKEAQENSAADAKKKEEVEIFNKADGLIFQTEKQLKEFGDKLSADKKAAIESAHGELKTAFEAKNSDDVKAKTEALDAAWMAASEEMYAAGQQPGADAGAQNAGGNNAGGAEDVQDADFEEVK